MKICDRCFTKDGSAVPAVDTITFGRDSEVLDVCETCKTEAREFVKNPPKKGKPDGRKTRKATGKDKKKSAGNLPSSGGGD